MKPDEQVNSETVETNVISSPTNENLIVSELSGEDRVKLDVILSLIEPCDRISSSCKSRSLPAITAADSGVKVAAWNG